MFVNGVYTAFCISIFGSVFHGIILYKPIEKSLNQDSYNGLKANKKEKIRLLTRNRAPDTTATAAVSYCALLPRSG